METSSLDTQVIRRSRGLVTLIGYNGIAQVTPMLALLGLTPVLIGRLGGARFGIWSLAIVALSTLTSLDGGVSASLARFFAVHAARSDTFNAGQLLTAALLFFASLGIVTTALAYELVPIVVPFLHIPAALEGEATWIFRWLPAVATLALASDAMIALLQGNGLFREAAGATVLSVLVFTVAVLALVQPGAHLRELLAAAALRYCCLAVSGLILARKQVSVQRPFLPSLAAAREVGRYASRMQLSALTGFVNAELDGFLIAAVAPIRYVGFYGIGLQVASAARSVPLYAFPPLLTRLTTTFGREGRTGTAVAFERLERRWLPGVLGYGVVAVAAAGFIAPIWLGHGYGLSGVTAAVLLAGYIVHAAFTGMRTCYVRAIGRPGLEARCSAVWTVVNVALTVPLALTVGMVGIVAATAGAAVVASIYFVKLCRREERLLVFVPWRRWWFSALAAAAMTVLGELLLVRSGLRGYGGLALSCLPPLVAVAVFGATERQRLRS